MTKKLFYIGIMAIVAIAFTNCSKDDINYYQSSYNAVRFPGEFYLIDAKGYDSDMSLFYASYSFIDNAFATSKEYDLPVILIGNKSNTDRTVAYTIDTKKTTAPAGSYEILKAVILADSIKGYIRVKLNNVEELQNATYELYLSLKASDSLNVGPNEYLQAVIQWNNMIPAPTNANHIRSYNMLIKSSLNFVSTSLANYSPRALKAIVNALGWDDWNDYSIHGIYYNNPTTYGGYKYLPRYNWIYSDNSYKSYALKLSDYIKAYNEAHPSAPLTHDAGALKGSPIEARSY
jgi:hypothetical protein